MKRSGSCFLIVFVFLAAATAQAGLYQEDRPVWIGHRGARALEDENTMESIRKAVELGVDMVEFDIQQTRDGVYVLMHDDTVDRTTDGTGRVDEMTLAEFKELKTESGYTPPTLDEALDYLQEEGISIILDIKCWPADDGEELYQIIRDRGLLESTVFESSKPRFAGAIERAHPEAETAIYPVSMPFMLIHAEKHDIDCVSYMWNFATPCGVWLSHRLGHDVVVWTVNKRRVIKWFYRLKVDGIMTDDPNLFKGCSCRKD
jgi:glycerophosphoryl diester phosphodiesterase